MGRREKYGGRKILTQRTRRDAERRRAEYRKRQAGRKIDGKKMKETRWHGRWLTF